MEEPNPELESFRQQWQAEVSARSRADESKAKSKSSLAQLPKRRQVGSSKLVAGDTATEYQEKSDFSRDASRLKGSDGAAGALTTAEDDVGSFGNVSETQEPRSALEHYEKAVERENQGSLGDSLNLYRKAFRVRTRPGF